MARSSGSFKPGQSGNPAGRPRGALGWRRRAREQALAALAQQRQAIAALPPPPEGRPYTIEDAQAIIDCALAGDISAIRRIVDAIEDDW